MGNKKDHAAFPGRRGEPPARASRDGQGIVAMKTNAMVRTLTRARSTGTIAGRHQRVAGEYESCKGDLPLDVVGAHVTFGERHRLLKKIDSFLPGRVDLGSRHTHRP